MEPAKPRKSVVVMKKKEVKEIEKEPGEVGKQWFMAQKEIKSGKQPSIVVKNGVTLHHMNKPRRTRTVFELQSVLDAATHYSQKPQMAAYDTDVSDDEVDFDELFNATTTTLEQNDTLFEVIQSPHVSTEDFLGMHAE